VEKKLLQHHQPLNILCLQVVAVAVEQIQMTLVAVVVEQVGI
jgi:hypothetical protein